MHHPELDKVAKTKASTTDPRPRGLESFMRDPPVFTKAGRPVNPPAEFRIYKFRKDKALLTDEHGRKTFSMMPITAQALAASMGAQALQV